MSPRAKLTETNGTKERIVVVATRLFSQYSYKGVSLDDIAKELKITKAALYYHFSSKEEIYMSVLDQIEYKLNVALKSGVDENESDPKKRLKQLFKNPLDYWYKDKDLMKSIIMALAIGDKKIIKRVTNTLEENFEFFHGEVKKISSKNKNLSHLDSRLTARMMMSLLRGLLVDDTLGAKRVDTEKMSNLLIDILFKD